MAGHSKWAQIKRGKGIADQRRSAVFSKLASGIAIAARTGTDPETNFQLRIAIDKAKAANMPKDNIERALERAKGSDAATLEEITFEAYGPGGTAFMIETATDNRNRTIGEIRAVLNKFGGKLAEAGSVGYLFKKRGLIVLPEASEEAELVLIDAGAEDFVENDNQLFLYTVPNELESVRQKLITAGFEPTEVSFELEPTTTIPITDEALVKKVINLSEALEELADVTNIASNFDLPETLLS